MNCWGEEGSVAGARRRGGCLLSGWWRAALVLALVGVSASAAQKNDLAVLRASFEGSLTKILAEHKARVQAVPETYVAGLKALMESRQKAGDLDSLLRVRSEFERFEREQSVPEASRADASPEVKALQEQYLKGGVAAGAEKRGLILALADRYVAQLNERVRSSTQAGDIDGALAYRGEIERAQALPEVAAAEFDRAADVPAGVGVAAPAPPPGAGDKCPACAGGGKGRVVCAACGGVGECSACGGHGKRAGLGSSMLMCTACRGSGKCRTCGGSGQTDTSAACELCQGSGRVKMVELKGVLDAPGSYEGKTVCVRVRVTRANLWGDPTSWNVGTVGVALRDPSPEDEGAWIPSREIPVASRAVAGKLARLVGKGGGPLVATLKVGTSQSPVIQDVYGP